MRAAAAGPISFPHRTKFLVYLLLSRDVFSQDDHHHAGDDDDDEAVIFNIDKRKRKRKKR